MPERRTNLLSWIAAIRAQFAGRIVGIDAAIAEQAGRLRAAAASAGRQADLVDALIAASALSRGGIVATRDIRDFAALGVTVFDPWTD